jgi:hypothetical protein
MPPAGSQHGRIAVNVGFLIEQWCRKDQRGVVLGNDAAISGETDPDTVRGAMSFSESKSHSDRWFARSCAFAGPCGRSPFAVRSVGRRDGQVIEYLAVG